MALPWGRSLVVSRTGRDGKRRDDTLLFTDSVCSNAPQFHANAAAAIAYFGKQKWRQRDILRAVQATGVQVHNARVPCAGKTRCMT